MSKDLSSGSVYETSDIAIAAYLMLRSLTMISALKPARGPYQFVFSDPDNIARKLAFEFASSDFCKFDAHLKYLRRLQ